MPFNLLQHVKTYLSRNEIKMISIHGANNQVFYRCNFKLENVSRRSSGRIENALESQNILSEEQVNSNGQKQTEDQAVNAVKILNQKVHCGTSAKFDLEQMGKELGQVLGRYRSMKPYLMKTEEENEYLKSEIELVRRENIALKNIQKLSFDSEDKSYDATKKETAQMSSFKTIPIEMYWASLLCLLLVVRFCNDFGLKTPYMSALLAFAIFLNAFITNLPDIIKLFDIALFASNVVWNYLLQVNGEFTSALGFVYRDVLFRFKNIAIPTRVKLWLLQNVFRPDNVSLVGNDSYLLRDCSSTFRYRGRRKCQGKPKRKRRKRRHH